MNLGNLKRFKSWLISAGITLGIGLWLISGSIFGDEEDTSAAATAATPSEVLASVRVRSQSADQSTAGPHQHAQSSSMRKQTAVLIQ